MSTLQSRQRPIQLNKHQQHSYPAGGWSNAEDDSGSETAGEFDAEDDEDASDYPDLDQDNEDIGLTVSDTDSEPNYRIDDENPTLMSFLKSDDDSSDGHGYSDLADHSDDSSIEREEEQHIQDDLDEDTSDELSRIRGPLRLGTSDDTESNQAGDETGANEFDGAMDHEDEDTDENDFFDDFFDPVTTPRAQRMYSATESVTKASEDDSYLWQYFFSSGDEDDDQEENDYDEDNEQTSDSPPEQNSQEGSSQANKQEHSGDSTDEEAALPKSTRRAQSNRATEVLGVNTYSTRPPVLGEWDIDNSQGIVGIIDGLTTRTLSPPGPGPTSVSSDRRIFDQNLHSDSDMSDLALDEFIKTDELSDDDGCADTSATISTPNMYRSRFNKNVPLSAFRNRTSPYPMPGFDGRRNRRRSFGREVVISPVRPPPRRMKKLKNSLRHRNDLDNLATKDLIEELVDIGAISPLFEI